ncbi:hypothetical protein Tco_0133308 [Tanacetum coccineum]
MREDSQNSSAGTLSTRYRNPSERPKMRDRLKNDGNVFGRLGHRRQSAFERLSDTYSPSTTKPGPDRANSRDHSHSRGRPHRRGSSSRDRPRSRDRSRGIEESYEGGEVNPRYLAYRRAAPAMEDTESQSQKGLSSALVMRPRGSRENFLSRSTGGTLGNAYVVSYVQFYPNRDRETKEVRQRSSGNPQYQAEGWRDHRGFHGAIQAPQRTRSEDHERNDDNSHHSPLPSYEEKLPPLPKRKVTHRGSHRTSPCGMFQSGNLISEVSQGKDGGLAGLPPYKNTQRNHRGRSRKVQTTTTHCNPGREEKQQQVLRLPQ